MRPTGVTASVTSSSRMVQRPISRSAALAGSGPSPSVRVVRRSHAAGARISASVTIRKGETRPARSRQGQRKARAVRPGRAGGKAAWRMACIMPLISSHPPAR
jgi:hypothetical protein